MSAQRDLRGLLASAAAWTTGLAWTVPATTAMMALQSVFRADQLEWASRIYTRGQLRAIGCRVRYEVDPAVEPRTTYMFCQNHVNHLDHCTLYDATPHFKQGLEHEDHFRYPVYGWFMKQRGTIPIRRGARGNLGELREQMRREVERGHSLLVFPEGTRTRDGHVGPFKTGAFVIARDLGIPIVPVSVVGMYEVMNAHSWRIRPGGKVTVYCDAPIETRGIDDAGIPALAERVRSVIATRVEKRL